MNLIDTGRPHEVQAAIANSADDRTRQHVGRCLIEAGRGLQDFCDVHPGAT